MLTVGPELLRPPGRLLRGLLWAVLRRAGGEHTLEEAGSLLTRRNIEVVRTVLVEGWMVSMPEPPARKRPGDERAKPIVRDWLDSWALATSRDGLALTDEQWLEMTPRLVHALSEQRLEAVRQQEYMWSTVAATVANWSHHAPKPPFQDCHFMRHPWPEDDARAKGMGPSAGDEFKAWVRNYNQWQTTK